LIGKLAPAGRKASMFDWLAFAVATPRSIELDFIEPLQGNADIVEDAEDSVRKFGAMLRPHTGLHCIAHLMISFYRLTDDLSAKLGKWRGRGAGAN
jgi:hypothetical protein